MLHPSASPHGNPRATRGQGLPTLKSKMQVLTQALSPTGPVRPSIEPGPSQRHNTSNTRGRMMQTTRGGG